MKSVSICNLKKYNRKKTSPRNHYFKTPLLTAISATLLSLSLNPAAFAVTDEEFRQLQDQFNQLADEVENNKRAPASNNTHIGGYGELHYNNLNNGKGDAKKQLDLHRFVLFLGHDFNDKTRFFSELEVEHANTEENGVVEVEQAYVQFDLNNHTRLNAGVILVPVGIINETHEPPAFYGVERNPVEKYIIPTTWSGGGVMLSGHYSNGFSYDVALHSGLKTDITKNNGTDIRGGRQGISEAEANNLAATARAKYTGFRGLELAATVQYQDNITQNHSNNVNSATLIETHARYNINHFTLTGLYARWDINGDGASSLQRNIQDGAYLEAAYKITPNVGIFARHNQWDNGGTGDTRKTQTNAGINYWPNENIVVKADYQAQNETAGNFDGFNLGIGYQF